MEIKEIKVMRGPNYWAGNCKKLIVLKLDIGDGKQMPATKIDSFNKSL